MIGGVVVKLGGEVVGDARLAGIAKDIVELAREGWRVTVVHGGGPQATAMQERLGIAARIVGGRRVTDEATLDVIKMVVGGKLNVDLCAAIAAAGGRPVGLHDAIRAVRRPPRVYTTGGSASSAPGAGDAPIDLGLVGDVTGFDLELIEAARAGGRVPVLACLGMGDGGEVYNINADVVANRLAVAMSADPLVIVTGVDGVRRDLADPASRIAQLTVAEGRRAIDEGVVKGGMIPKLTESFAALADGVKAILIVAGDVARAVREPGSGGTRLLP
jgi:acetylglutamate kinase